MALRIAVLMKTDMVESTPRFRAEPADDLEALLRDHQQLIVKCSADHGGSIFRSDGDGFWLEFPSVTGAAKAGMAIQDTLRLGQLTQGDSRLAIRITIGAGDVAMQDGELVGELLALITRIEAITPADEIYLTAGARLALNAADVQTELVESFALKGFPAAVPVYRVQRRHRMQVIADVFILIVDLRGFGRVARTGDLSAVERVLETFTAHVNSVAREHDATIRYSDGDAYLVTFLEASQAATAAGQLMRAWAVASDEDRSGCGVHLLLHRGSIALFRSYVFGKGSGEAWQLMAASRQWLGDAQSALFITEPVRDALSGDQWHNRLRPVGHAPADGPELYRLDDA